MNPKFAVFHFVVGIAMYVVRDASAIQMETALEGLRKVDAPPEAGRSGL